MEKISTWLLEESNLALATAFFTLFCIFAYGIFEISNYSYKRKKNIPYNGLKFTTRNITYIAMMIAVSVAVTVVISVTLPITVFPPIRVAFEGIMIKITGMIFGPVVGIIVGLITEILAMIFVPSFIHIAYLLVAVGFGFWSGLASFTFKLKGKKQMYTYSMIVGFILIFTAFMYFILVARDSSDPISFFGFEISSAFFPIFFIIMMSVTLGVISLLTLVLYFTKNGKWLNIVLPILLICTVTEVLSTILLAAWGDNSFMQSGYMSMVVVRLAQTPIKILFNTAVLTTVYSVMKPLIKGAK
ncbi:ECF transporter S component [Mesoplasma photuris]|uniref:ECF transporter S component n=1 Tax=Mesoplasma photuris TaxID=217731 RepID=UPI0004E275AC|nr:ECF transporter S component [Mesoplasma photuris]